MKQRIFTDLGAGINLDLLRRHLPSISRHLDRARVRNILSTLIERRLRKTELAGRPFMIKVEATNRCRFSCPGCYTGTDSDPHPRGKMQLALFREILDALGSHLVKIALYAWGEPLLNEKIYDMVRMAEHRNIGTLISTSLNDFQKADTEPLFASGLEHLIVSVDGMTQEIYEQYRRGGDLKRVLGNLEHILGEKKRRRARFPVVEMQYIVFPHNAHEIPRTKRKAREMGVDLLTFLQGQALTPRERAFGRGSRRRRPNRCDLLWTSTYINWDGTVSPCCFVNQNVFGSLREETFEQIWNGPAYRESREFASGGADDRNRGRTATLCRQCLLRHKGEGVR
jgi:MoaA/NifB/PqqE/SkfB family radical SAM enzyme